MDWNTCGWMWACVGGLTNLINDKLFSFNSFSFLQRHRRQSMNVVFFRCFRLGMQWQMVVEWMKNWCNLLYGVYVLSVYRMFCSMQCLQPVDPDVQKHRILKQYEQQQQAIKLCTLDNQQKIIHLFKHVNLMSFFLFVLFVLVCKYTSFTCKYLE